MQNPILLSGTSSRFPSLGPESHRVPFGAVLAPILHGVAAGILGESPATRTLRAVGWPGAEMSESPTTRPEFKTGPERAIICNTMPSLRVQIVRFVEAYQPGIVECQFCDSEGQTHSIVGKLPYFTAANLWFDSEYPQPGEVDCRVLGPAANGAVRIVLGEETTEGRSEVVVPESDLIV